MVENVLRFHQRGVYLKLQSAQDVSPPALLSLDWVRVIAPFVHLAPGRWQNARTALAIGSRKLGHGPGQDGALAEAIRGRRAMGARQLLDGRVLAVHVGGVPHCPQLRSSSFYQTIDNPLFFLTKKQVRGSMAAKCSLFYTWSQQAVPTGINVDAIWATLSFGSKAAHQCGLRPLSRALRTIAKHSAGDLPGSVGECFSRSRCQWRSDVMPILFAAR